MGHNSFILRTKVTHLKQFVLPNQCIAFINNCMSESDVNNHHWIYIHKCHTSHTDSSFSSYSARSTQCNRNSVSILIYVINAICAIHLILCSTKQRTQYISLRTYLIFVNREQYRKRPAARGSCQAVQETEPGKWYWAGRIVDRAALRSRR